MNVFHETLEMCLFKKTAEINAIGMFHVNGQKVFELYVSKGKQPNLYQR